MNDARPSAPTAPDDESPVAVLTAVSDLATAVEQAALVQLALSSGLLQHCAEPVTESDLARTLEVPRDRLTVVCDALVALGALVRVGDRVRLSPAWAPLTRDGVHVTLERVFAGAAVRTPMVRAAFAPSTDYWQQDPAQRLAMADWFTMATTTEFGRNVVSGVLAELSEIADGLREGARWLELGCGVAGMLLGALHDHPALTGVGVDLADDLLDVAGERARELGVADRVRFVRADATTYTDDEPFDIVFWSQFFFPTHTRKAALANVYERLRPGGTLVCPVLPGDLEPYSSGSSLAQQASLHALVFSGWGVPILSGDELAEELRTAGFQVGRIRRDGLPILLLASRDS